MIVRFHRAFAVSSGLVYLAGEVAVVSDEDGYAAVAVKAAEPGRRAKVRLAGVMVRSRTCDVGDVVDLGDFDSRYPVSAHLEPTIRIVATAPFTYDGEPIEVDAELDVPVATAPNLVFRGVAEFKDDAVWPLAS